jgi:hypothetical protein
MSGKRKVSQSSKRSVYAATISRKGKPRTEKRGAHFVLSGSGAFALPQLVRCEGLEKGRWTNQWVIRAYTDYDQRLYLPIVDQAAKALLNAPAVVVPLEPTTHYELIDPRGLPEPTELPLLERFGCFRVIDDTKYIPEFLTENNQQVLVPFTFVAYRELFAHLKAFR